MCTVMDLSTSILASLFAPLMFAGLPNHFPLLTMIKRTQNPINSQKTTQKKNQRSLRDSTILYGVCVGEMLVLKAICDALTH